jgi:hypothetical protein
MLLAEAPRLSDYRTTSAAEPRAHQGHVAAVRWSGPAITTRAQWPRPRAPEASGQPARLPARCGEGLDAPEVAVRDLLGQIQVAQTRRRSSSRGPPGARTVRKRPSQAFASPALGGTWPAGTSDGSASRAAQSMRTSRARRPTSCRSSRLSVPSSSAESPASLASRSAHVSGPLPGSVTERPLRCRSRASMTGAASSRIFARKGRTPPGWQSSIPYHCHRSGHGKGYSTPRRSSAAASRRRRSRYSRLTSSIRGPPVATAARSAACRSSSSISASTLVKPGSGSPPKGSGYLCLFPANRQMSGLGRYARAQALWPSQRVTGFVGRCAASLLRPIICLRRPRSSMGLSTCISSAASPLTGQAPAPGECCSSWPAGT